MLKGTLNTLQVKNNTIIERDDEGMLVRMVFPDTLDPSAPTFYLDLGIKRCPTDFEVIEF